MSTSFLQDDLGYIPAATPVSPNMTGISTPPTSSADDIVFPPYQTLQRKRQLSSTNPDSLNPLSPKRIRQDPIPTPLSSYGESQISINLSGITDLLVSLDNRCREEFQALRDLRKEITEIKEKVTRTETSIAFIVNQNDHIQGVLSRLIPSHPNSERESPVIGQARDLVELIDDLEVDCGVNGEGDSDEVDEVVKRGCDRESTGFSYDPAIDSFIVQEPSEFVDEDSNGEVVMVERGESDIEINVRSEEPRNSSPPGATPSNETETTKEVNDITDNIGEQGTSEQHRNSDVDDIHLAGGIMESENTPKALSSLNTSEAEPERDLTTAMSEDESNPNSMESAGVQNGSDVKVVEQVNHESSQQNLTNDGVLEVETDESSPLSSAPPVSSTATNSSEHEITSADTSNTSESNDTPFIPRSQPQSDSIPSRSQINGQGSQRRQSDRINSPSQSQRRNPEFVPLPLRANGILKCSDGRGNPDYWPERQANTVRGRMQEIACDECSGRTHWACAGLADDLELPQDQEWICPECQFGTRIRRADPNKCIRPNCILRLKQKIVHRESDDEQYFPERVIGAISRNPDKTRVFEYLIKWEGWAVKDATWESEGNIAAHPEMLQDFKRKIEFLPIRKKRVGLLPEATLSFDEAGELKGEGWLNFVREISMSKGLEGSSEDGVVDISREKSAEVKDGILSDEGYTVTSVIKSQSRREEIEGTGMESQEGDFTVNRKQLPFPSTPKKSQVRDHSNSIPRNSVTSSSQSSRRPLSTEVTHMKTDEARTPMSRREVVRVSAQKGQSTFKPPKSIVKGVGQ